MKTQLHIGRTYYSSYYAITFKWKNSDDIGGIYSVSPYYILSYWTGAGKNQTNVVFCNN